MDPIHLELPIGLPTPFDKTMEVYCNPCKNLLCICICIHEIIYSDNLSDLSMSQTKGDRVTTEVMLRNPWGQKEWTGDYSNSSDRWGIWLGLQVGVFGHWKKLGIFRGLLWFRSSMISMIRKCGKNWTLSTQEILLRKFYSVKLLKSDWTLSTRCWFSTIFDITFDLI